MITLVAKVDTYDLVFKKDTPEEATFKMKKLTIQELSNIEDSIARMQKDNTVQYLGGTEKLMKIDKCLMDWEGVVDANGTPMKCNSEYKKQLPVSIRDFLLKDIDETNGLVNSKEKEETEKN